MSTSLDNKNIGVYAAIALGGLHLFLGIIYYLITYNTIFGIQN